MLPLAGVISAVLALHSRLLGSFLQFYSTPACWDHFCSSSPALPFAGVVSAVLQCSRLLDSFLQYVRRANPVGSSSDPTQLFVTDFGLAELFQLTWPPCNTSLPVAAIGWHVKTTIGWHVKTTIGWHVAAIIGCSSQLFFAALFTPGLGTTRRHP